MCTCVYVHMKDRDTEGQSNRDKEIGRPKDQEKETKTGYS